MDEHQWLAQRFEESREHLRAVAYRMMGSLTEADDAVQESWLRLMRTNANEIDNLKGWLTTVVAHVCLDMLRSRKSRREESLDASPAPGSPPPDLPAVGRHRSDPENEALLADSVGLALLVVLERLTPAERLAFVLHDMFDLGFDEIGGVLGRSAVAARQLASRARRRVRGGSPSSAATQSQQRRVVEAFLAALRAGDFNALVSLLDPDVVVHVDATALPKGVPPEVRGAEAWARQAITLARGAKLARAALINGAFGVVIAPRGRLFRALQLTFADGRIAQIEVIGDPTHLRALDITLPDN